MEGDWVGVVGVGIKRLAGKGWVRVAGNDQEVVGVGRVVVSPCAPSEMCPEIYGKYNLWL